MSSSSDSSSKARTTKSTLSSSAAGASVTPFAITTTFIPSSQCAQSVGGLTMLKNEAYEIWLNALIPVPGTTITSCYADQFATSYLLEKGGISQAPFSPLVCPDGYQTQGPYTSNYIACCPSGWDGIALAPNAPSDRPAYLGTCYSNIYNVPIPVTVYDDNSIQASSIFTATATNAQAYAYPYEGFAFGVAVIGSVVSSGSAAVTSTSTGVAQASGAITTGNLSSSKVSGGAIAGIVIGVIAVVGLLVSLVFFIRRWKQRQLIPEHLELGDEPRPLPATPAVLAPSRSKEIDDEKDLSSGFGDASTIRESTGMSTSPTAGIQELPSGRHLSHELGSNTSERRDSLSSPIQVPSELP